MPSSWYKEFMAQHGVNVGSRKVSPRRYSGPAMDAANMREMGVRSLLVSCLDCHHSKVVNIDEYPGETILTVFDGRFVCRCGSKNSDVRPNWKEMPVWKGK